MHMIEIGAPTVPQRVNYIRIHKCEESEHAWMKAKKKRKIG